MKPIRIYMNTYEEALTFIERIRPICSKVYVPDRGDWEWIHYFEHEDIFSATINYVEPVIRLEIIKNNPIKRKEEGVSRMNSAEKQTVLHCLKSMIDEAVCEECPLYGMTGTDHCEKDCVRLAINALEQDPCDDAISRRAVLNYIYNDLGLGDEENGKDVERQMELDESYRYVKSLPPITSQPKQRTGQWEKHERYRIHYCSECGYGHIDEWHDEKHWNFCPNCGAKMGDE